MRIENIADVFDSAGEVIYQKVNVEQLAIELFNIANSGSPFEVRVLIEETSLTANQSYAEMKENRLKWKTVDDTDFCKGEKEEEDFTKMKFQ